MPPKVFFNEVQFSAWAPGRSTSRDFPKRPSAPPLPFAGLLLSLVALPTALQHPLKAMAATASPLAQVSYTASPSSAQSARPSLILLTSVAPLQAAPTTTSTLSSSTETSSAGADVPVAAVEAQAEAEVAGGGGADDDEAADVGAAGTGAVVDMDVFEQLLEIVSPAPLVSGVLQTC